MITTSWTVLFRTQKSFVSWRTFVWNRNAHRLFPELWSAWNEKGLWLQSADFSQTTQILSFWEGNKHTFKFLENVFLVAKNCKISKVWALLALSSLIKRLLRSQHNTELERVPLEKTSISSRLGVVRQFLENNAQLSRISSVGAHLHAEALRLREIVLELASILKQRHYCFDIVHSYEAFIICIDFVCSKIH